MQYSFLILMIVLCKFSQQYTFKDHNTDLSTFIKYHYENSKLMLALQDFHPGSLLGRLLVVSYIFTVVTINNII